MKPLITIALVCSLALAATSLTAQPWINDVKSDNPTFKEIQDAFYGYWKDKPIGKGQGYKQFKRWEWYWEPRLLPNGDFPSSSITWDEYHKYLKSHPDIAGKTASSAANWTFKGPTTTPGGYNGLGRVNCMAFHPTNANTFWVGTPAGGLWKTTNGGTTWTTNTDNLPVLGVSDIAIDPTNANIMYIATGDGDMGSLSALNGGSDGDTKSVGVLKSTNGGNSWSTTGLNWNMTSSKLIRRLLLNPNNTQTLIAAASDGIWRTTNGGSTWTNVQPGYFIDAEFKPGDPSIVYAATYSPSGGAQIFRSTNSGASWTAIGYDLNTIRFNLAVTPAWPELVDALGANTQGGLSGLFYSSNSGASFTSYFTGDCNNNLLAHSYNASGCGGQGNYDLANAINPNNSNDIWLGGVNTWNTTDGGATWYSKTMWSPDAQTNPNGVPTVHADKHFIAFHPLVSGTMFECNDGGLYKTTNGGASWTDLSNGLGISQIYRIGVSQQISNNVICGLQDNGSREIYNNQWYEQTGGDGMECIIDYTNPDTEYASYAQGVIYRTYDFWANTTTISNNIPGQPQGAWVTPFVMHPTNPNVLYAGYDRLYASSNQGNSWTAISPYLTGNLLRSVAVAPSNSNYIFVANYDTLYLTQNGGTDWYYVPLGVPNAKITYITFHPTNPQKVYVTLSGYAAGEKVYTTSDGGATWSNYSGTLPNVPVNCITYQNGSNEGLYIGTDVGVFYRDASMSDWIPYQTNLPNVVVTELEISYNDNKLWAATFGRGLWNSDLYSTSVAIEEIDKAVKLYPNPNNGNFTLEIGGYEAYDVVVYNTLGEKIWEKYQISQKQLNVNLDDATSGVYFVQVIANGQLLTHRLLVTK